MAEYTHALAIESRLRAESLGIPTDDPRGFGHNDERDAFRHAYSSGVIAHDYGSGIAHAAGVYHEYENDADPRRPQPPGEDRMDTFNNAVGRNIGANAENRDEIAQNSYNALARGDLIIDPNSKYPASPFPQNDDLYTQPRGIPNSDADDWSIEDMDDDLQDISDPLYSEDFWGF